MTLRDPDFETHETDVLTTFEDDVPVLRGGELLRRYAPAIVALVSVIVAWEILVRAFSVQSFILPRPSEIITEFFANASVIWSNGYRTLQEAVGGFIVGTILGQAGVNIDNMDVGREEGGGTAIMVLDVGQTLPATVADALRRADGVLSVDVIDIK